MRGHKRIRSVALMVIVLVAGAALWRLWGMRPTEPQNAILASGTIEAIEVDVSAKVSGRILKLLVDEGDTVQAGQVIALLDGREIQAQVVQAQGAYEAARARLAELLRGAREEEIRQARASLAQAQAAADGARRTLETVQEMLAKATELKAQMVSAQTAYEAAENAYRQAKAKLELVEAGARSEQVAQAYATVEQAKAQALNAQQDAERAESLYAGGAISKQQLDAAIARRDSARAALGAAEARLAEILAGARAEEREQARAAEAQARAQLEGARRNLLVVQELYTDRLPTRQQLELARTQYRTALEGVAAARARLDMLLAGAREETVQAARAQVEQARGALESARAMTDYLTIRAPVPGRVILKIAEQGELVTPGMPIVRIANLETVWLKVYVPEPNMRVKLGDRAEVVVDAYPEKRFEGRVTQIADKPEFTPKNVQTKEERVKLVFGVKITLANPKGELKPGMPADATIFLSEASP
ncbi:MAG: efflux RND transporter periplasmic adaptor subunit [Armatimonadota bacterium]|nr:efflux RND transporter periplasmic adaptor subunit [Armatimonadota bacterium]